MRGLKNLRLCQFHEGGPFKKIINPENRSILFDKHLFQRHLKGFLVVTFCSIQYFQYIFGSFQTRGLNPRNSNHKSTCNPTQFNHASN